MLALLGFTVRQMLLHRKVWVTLLLLAGPCALTLLIRSVEPAEDLEDVWNSFHGPVQFMAFLIVLPLICMLCGTSLIGAEVDGRTLVYLLTRKMRRATVLLVRFAATALVLAILFDLALVAQYFCAVGGVDLPALADTSDLTWKPLDDLLCYLAVGPLGVLAFLAIFSLIGLLSSRPLSASIVYVLVVEFFLSNLPAGARVYTILHQLHLTMFGAIPRLTKLYDLPREDVARFFPPDSTGTVALCIISLVAVALACVLMTTRELVPAKVARE
jgi:ABC-type transport system involved in multi-copper enzyme maturation permease subunit